MEERELCALAFRALDNAYAPYSGFKVGAALLCADGSVYTGCNVENVSFGATNCAERTAVFKAVSEGRRAFKAIAIASSSGKPTPPCGICRQVLSEFSGDMTVYLCGRDETVKTSIRELLPRMEIDIV